MELFLTLIIFCITLFVYIHIYHHKITSNDLEIFDIDVPSKERLEELCELRQPLTMHYKNDELTSNFNNKTITNMYGAFDINIRNNELNDNGDKYIMLAYNTSDMLFNKDKNQNYNSENNTLFLSETTLIKHMQNNDIYLRPYMVSSCKYDLLIGTNLTRTPLRYDICNRHYLYVTEGKIKIKLTPPCNTKYLYRENDYEMLEFRSKINVWEPQEQYIKNFNKVKFLEFEVNEGTMVYIPPYWWYSIEYSSEKTNIVLSFKYTTYMNTLSITPELLIHYLQTMNVKFKTENIFVQPNAVPANAVPPNAVPANAVPPNAVPANAVPANAVPPNAVPANAVPPNAVPANAVPANAVPANAVPDINSQLNELRETLKKNK